MLIDLLFLESHSGAFSVNNLLPRLGTSLLQFLFETKSSHGVIGVMHVSPNTMVPKVIP